MDLYPATEEKDYKGLITHDLIKKINTFFKLKLIVVVAFYIS